VGLKGKFSGLAILVPEPTHVCPRVIYVINQHISTKETRLNGPDKPDDVSLMVLVDRVTRYAKTRVRVREPKDQDRLARPQLLLVV
jgi:hypothetical protein